MLKKPFPFLNKEHAIKLACAAAHDLDQRLNQVSLGILQGLVSSSEIISHKLTRLAIEAFDVSRPIARKIQKRLKKELKKQYQQQHLDQWTKEYAKEFLQAKGAIAWQTLKDREALSQAMDRALQAISKRILEALILIFTQYAYPTARKAFIRSVNLQRYWHQHTLPQIQQEFQAYIQQSFAPCDHWLRHNLGTTQFQRLYALSKPSIYGVILAAAVIGTTSNADVADEMKVLIEQKKASEAFVLGTKHPELMGDPLFDYFYGVAAVEVGHPTAGVLALERVLLNDPNNDLVRLELARAYYAQGDYQRAKDEFTAVKKNQPPAGVVATINVYLDDIKAKDAQFKTTYGIYVELGMGYNNNVNAATAVNNIILPYVGPVTLGASSMPQKSAFGYDSIGANVSMPITSDVSVFANANTSAQRYSQVNGYDLNVSNATTGVKVTDGPNTYKVAGFGSIAQIDQVPIPNTYGVGGEYVRQLTATDSVMLAGGSTVLQYPSQFNAYNSNLNVGTVAYRKAFPDRKWQPVIDVSANMAHQIDTSNRPDLGRRIAGGALQLSFLPSEKVGVTIGTAYAKSKYDANDLLYQAGRTDNLYSANAVLQYKLTKELSARMELTYYNNLSNLNLYGYEQWTGAIKLRYDWNSN
jgi:tetratricopeptide (TPR) repeat protein